MKTILEWKQGNAPEKNGWYLVRLEPGHVEGDREYDVDRFHDGRWVKWYRHNITHYAEIDE